MVKKILNVLKCEDKTPKAGGKDYLRCETTEGWASVFDASVIKALKMAQIDGKEISVDWKDDEFNGKPSPKILKVMKAGLEVPAPQEMEGEKDAQYEDLNSEKTGIGSISEHEKILIDFRYKVHDLRLKCLGMAMSNKVDGDVYALADKLWEWVVKKTPTDSALAVEEYEKIAAGVKG